MLGHPWKASSNSNSELIKELIKELIEELIEELIKEFFFWNFEFALGTRNSLSSSTELERPSMRVLAPFIKPGS